jgi:hypothetical protein
VGVIADVAEPSVELLGSSANLLFLSNISSGLYTRLLNRRDAGVKDGPEGEGPDEDLLEGYEAVLGWVWTIIAAAICGTSSCLPSILSLYERGPRMVRRYKAGQLADELPLLGG